MHYRSIATGMLLTLTAITSSRLTRAQAFRKGSLLVSITEGATHAHYSTSDFAATPLITHDGNLSGDRDPLTIEYGLNSKWGMAVNLGGDVFHVSPASLYQIRSADSKIITSEITIEGNYHYFISKRWDLAVAGALGLASVTFKGDAGDANPHQYNAGGAILRVSGKARFYFWRRIGLIGMLSTYTSSCTPDATKNNSCATQTNTTITGWATEFGLCYRILK